MGESGVLLLMSKGYIKSRLQEISHLQEMWLRNKILLPGKQTDKPTTMVIPTKSNVRNETKFSFPPFQPSNR